jgi:hypothetical protein
VSQTVHASERIDRGVHRRAALAGASALWIAVVVALPASAEVRTVETIGAVPIVEGVRPRRAPRDAAILQAQFEAVAQVANELLIDADPSGQAPSGQPGWEGEGRPSVEQVLGSDVGPYTHRFRIVQDRGEGPPVYSDDPEARAEYVVVVEVQVDAARVRDRLVEAGLLTASGAPPEGRSFVLEVRGLNVYPAYAALRELIVTGAGARSVVPVSMGRDWVVLRVESEDSGPDFLDKLLASSPPELDLLPLEADRDRLRLGVRWTPPAEPDA